MRLMTAPTNLFPVVSTRLHAFVEAPLTRQGIKLRIIHIRLSE